MLMLFRRIVLVLMLFLLPGSAPPAVGQTLAESAGQVWQVGARRWNVDEEQRFAIWVESNVTEDFFLRYRIAVDCADVPYAIRWIYARIAHLPAAVTTDDGRLLGHWSTAWQGLPTAKDWYRDRRFRAALDTILNETSTKTLPFDTYPIRIDRDSLTAGAAFLYDGHAGIIARIVMDGSTYSPIQTWEATLPRKVTQLSDRNYFPTDADKETGTGMLRFRWPVLVSGRWQYLQPKSHPYYSLEQYGKNFCRVGESFDRAVARRIDPKQYEPRQRIRLIIASLYAYLLERANIVTAGFNHCMQQRCPEGSYFWEVYSTPSRDDRIDFEIIHLHDLLEENHLNKEYLNASLAGLNIPIGKGRKVTMQYVVDNYAWLSHDPNDTIEARWGLSKCNMIWTRMKDALIDLEFAEQRYRSTNPAYAERRRHQINYEMHMLKDEEKKSGCNDLPATPAMPHQPEILPIRVPDYP